MDKITDHLYLGDIRAAANLFLLKQHVSKVEKALLSGMSKRPNLTPSSVVCRVSLMCSKFLRASTPVSQL